MLASGRMQWSFALIGAALALARLSAPAYADDAAYCSAGGRHNAAAPAPASLESAIAGAFQVSPDVVHGGAYVRCRQGKLIACIVGANLVCGKADARRRLAGASAFCAQNPDAESVPMVATGHATIYDWSCKGTTAGAGKVLMTVDPQGYIADNWKEIH